MPHEVSTARFNVGENVQVSRARFDGGGQRSPLRAARAQLLPADALRPELQLAIRRDAGHREERISLFGRRVMGKRMRIRSSREMGDAEPSFAGHCICIRERAGDNHGLILAFPSAEALEDWCNALCVAGCVMSDLLEHVTISAVLDEVHNELDPHVRLVKPKTSRTGTGAELLALKAASDHDKQTQLMNEAHFLMVLDNPGIIRGHGLYGLKVSDEPGLGMLIDYKAGSDLTSWIPAGGLPEWSLKGIMAQIRDALLYLHRRSIVHRDIKPSNVLCERGEDGSVKVCLADFGLAAYAVELDKVSVRCGSAGYIAPEIFELAWSEMFTSPPEDLKESTQNILKTDIFSVGMLIYVAAKGVNPFIDTTIRQTYKNNSRGIIDAEGTSAFTTELQDLLKSCTARNPRARCSIFDIADHAWFLADLRQLGFAGADDDLRGDSVSWAVFEEESRRRQN
jgi:hypothetical protein